MNPTKIRFCAIRHTFIFAIALGSTATAQIPVIELNAIVPTAAKIGDEFELHIAAGTRTEEVHQLRFSHPGISATLLTGDSLAFNEEPEKRYGHFRVRIGADVPAGRYEVRAVGRHGVSNPRSLLVHNITNQKDVSASHEKAAPTTLPADTLIVARATPSQVDYYRFDGLDGQTLRIDLLASQIDSRMIAQLDLYDERGKIIQSVHGSDELDPHLILPVHSDQSYTLAVYDSIYRGGPEYSYQLIIRDSNHASNLIRRNESQQWFPRAITDFSALVENATPVEERSDARRIELPCQITAEFDSNHDVDIYEFAAKKSDAFYVEVVSERLGQPTDSRLLIQREIPHDSDGPKWESIANDDDSNSITDGALRLHSKDPTISFTVPVDGNYRLILRDLDTGSALGHKQRYWIDIRKPTPGFDLLAYAHYPQRDTKQFRQRGSHIFPGGGQAIRVFAVRRDGWKGPIEIAIKGLPEGTKCPPATIAADRDQVQLVVTAAHNARPNVSDLKIIGKAIVGDQEVAVVAKNATTQWGRSGGRDFHRVRQCHDLAIAISNNDVAAVSLSIDESVPTEVKPGSELKLPIKLIRRESGKQDCVVRPRDLPHNCTAGEVKISKDKLDGELTLKVNSNAIPGTYSFWLQTETKIQHKPNPQALERAKAYRSKLQKLHDDPTNKDQMDAIKAAIKIADDRVNVAAQNASDQELTVFLPSPHITIRIADQK